jgi:hypothetical protein
MSKFLCILVALTAIMVKASKPGDDYAKRMHGIINEAGADCMQAIGKNWPKERFCNYITNACAEIIATNVKTPDGYDPRWSYWDDHVQSSVVKPISEDMSTARLDGYFGYKTFHYSHASGKQLEKVVKYYF